jgi:hypothetical protein
MQYMLMCCFNEKAWDDLPESQRNNIMRDYGEWVQSTTRSGHYVAGAKLRGIATATTLREKNARAVITDGPFAETKEHLGGYHVIECKDLDEAISIARGIPTLPFGGAIEVRPIAPLPALATAQPSAARTTSPAV